MDPRHLDLAAEFCSIVDAPDLLTYLKVDADADEEQARAKLKARRKRMQGMQGNPKYKAEALFLIKHFAALNGVLGDLPAYRAAARRRAESEHLPILEMTIRGVLAGGGLTREQEEFLRHNAIQLGVSERTYEEILRRLCREAGVPMVGGLPTPPPAIERGRAPVDLYQLLEIDASATPETIAAAYQRKRTEAEVRGTASPDLIRRLDIAKKVLTNTAARQHYDLTAARTGPPARKREYSPPIRRQELAATAPPVRPRSIDPDSMPSDQGLRPRLEVLGDPIRALTVGQGLTEQTITLRNGGGGRMAGQVSVDVPWVRVRPGTLDPDAEEQVVSVAIDPSRMPTAEGTAVVTVVTEKGERARVVFELTRRNLGPLVAGAVAAVVIVLAIAAGVVLQFS